MRRRVVERQPVRPVGRQQRERVPPLAAPPLADAAALEHDVVASGLGEQAAEGEPRLAGTDDERLDEVMGGKRATRRSMAGNCSGSGGARRRAAHYRRVYRALPPALVELAAMTTIASSSTLRNGIDTAQVYGTLDVARAQPELARFEFRVRNRWIDGTHSRSTIHGFWRRRRGRLAPRSRSSSTPASRPSCSVTTRRRTPRSSLLHALAGCLTLTIVNVAAARKVALHEVSSTLTGVLDARGAPGLDDSLPQRVRAHRGRVHDQGRRAAPRSSTRSSTARQVPLGRLRHGHQRRAGRPCPADVELRPPWSSPPARGRRRPGRPGRAARRRLREAAPPRTTATAPTRTRASRPLRDAGYLVAPVPRSSAASASSSVHDLVVASGRLARGDASVAIGVNMHLIAVLALARRLQVAAPPATRGANGAFAASLRDDRPRRRVIAAAP